MFFPQGEIELKVRDFIRAKYFTKKVKDEIRIELKNIEKINKAIAVINFPKIIAVIDGINYEKNLFHYLGSRTIDGIIRFSETDIIPEEGKFLEIFFVSKKDKKHDKTIFKAIEIRETEETNTNLIKSISGNFLLKYKRGGSTIGYCDLGEDEIIDTLPGFGFIGDFYVQKNVVKDNIITNNCNIPATAIFSGDKWKIIKLDKV